MRLCAARQCRCAETLAVRAERECRSPVRAERDVCATSGARFRTGFTLGERRYGDPLSTFVPPTVPEPVRESTVDVCAANGAGAGMGVGRRRLCRC